MRLTPLDVRKQEFRKGMRGLDADEVYAFLATVADEYEAVLNDNKALRDRLLELDDKVQEYRNMEKTLRDTLLTAERVSIEAKDSARHEAQLIIKEAQLDAEKGARDVKESAMRLRQEIQNLKQQRDSYLARMRAVVESHLKYLKAAESDFIEEENKLDADIKKWAGETEITHEHNTAAKRGPAPRETPVPAAPSRTSFDESAERDLSSQTTSDPPFSVYRETIETDRQPGSIPPARPTGAATAGAVNANAPTGQAKQAESSAAVAVAEPEDKVSLKDLLDRVIDTHADEPEAPVGSADDKRSNGGTRSGLDDDTTQEPDNSKPESGGDKWSLSRLKNDILARSNAHEEDRSDA